MSKFGYAVCGLMFIVLVAGGLSWRGSQPASPSEISAAVADLSPQQRERFGRYIDATKMTFDLKNMGKPLTRNDINTAVEFAKTEDADAIVSAQQDQVLNSALRPTNRAPGKPQP